MSNNEKKKGHIICVCSRDQNVSEALSLLSTLWKPINFKSRKSEIKMKRIIMGRKWKKGKHGKATKKDKTMKELGKEKVHSAQAPTLKKVGVNPLVAKMQAPVLVSLNGKRWHSTFWIEA